MLKVIGSCVIHRCYVYISGHKSVTLWRSMSTVYKNTASGSIATNKHELVCSKWLGFFPPVSTLTTLNLTVKFIAKCVGYYIHRYYMYSNWHKSVTLWRSMSTVLHTVSTVNTARWRIESNEHELVHPKRLFFSTCFIFMNNELNTKIYC